MKQNQLIITTIAGLSLTTPLFADDSAATPAAGSIPAAWQKPVWLTDLSLGVKESYDDNLFLVSGNGLTPQSSWVTTVSPKIGFNFAPLLGDQKNLQTLSLVYAPDFNIYHAAPSQSYDAHKIGDTIKGQAGDFSYSLDNAFLYNDGDHQAEIYGPAGGAGGNAFDQFRNNYAHGVPRERLAQTQDRANVVLQYDWDKAFVRPVATLLDYNMMTDLHNTGTAPWQGYQNYVSRYDVNGGVDLGYKLTPKLAATLGYRYGGNYQQQLPATISPADRHYSSSSYQRVLLGLEGKPWNWLNVKLAGGPDFRDYNYMTPVADRNPVKYYGEAVLTATLTPDQTLTFNYKQQQWVSSTGKIPEFDSTYSLAYHWSATRQLGLDLGGKVLEADYTEGNDYSGATQPSHRDDMEYEVSGGITYAFTTHLSATLAYTYDVGANALNNLPATLGPEYRNFEHQVASLGLQYRF